MYKSETIRKREQRPYTPLMISGTPVERVSSFKYLGVNISEDLTWTAHIQPQVKKARQRLYDLRQLRKFRVSPAILKNFLLRGHRKCTDSVHLSVVWKRLKSGLQSSAESRASQGLLSPLCRTSTSNAAKAELSKGLKPHW